MSKYLVFAIVALSLLLSAISSTSVAVAFPIITSSFETSLVMAGWVLSIYRLVVTVAMPLSGKASDLFGRKLVFITSMSLFTIGSLLCAIAPNIQLLILFRFIQAAGGGGFMPSAAGMVAEAFPKSRQRAIGLFTSIFPIGMIIGPNLGAWMTQAFGWRSIFWFNVPLGIVILIAAAFILRPGQRVKGHFDLLGAGLFAGSLFSVMAGLSTIKSGVDGTSWLLPGLLFLAGIVLLITFVRHERRSKSPIIDFAVIKTRPFIAVNIYNFIFGSFSLGLMSFIPLYAVSVYSMSLISSGLILTSRSVGVIIASAVTSVFLARWGYRRPMLIGTTIVALILFLLGLQSPGMNIMGIQLSSTVLLTLIMLLAGVGIGIASPAANNACIELMPERVSTIVGMRGLFRNSAGALSVAIVSLLLQSIGDMARGFTIVFFALGVVMLTSIPLIFAMPRGPRTTSLYGDTYD
ncbi:MFS transporter [Chloroflexota bacterium]